MRVAPQVVVIIPAFNEERNLPSVLEEIRDLEQPPDVVVVDDGSSDGTGDVARSAGVPVIALPVNGGMFCALQAGFRYAYRHGYDIAIQVDADGQHDPAGIPELIAPIVNEGADVVIGSRYLGDVHYTMPWTRRIGTKVFAGLTSILVGQRITDTTCGFRAYSRAAIRLFARETGFEFRDAVGLVVLIRGGFVLREVPTTVRARRSGHSSINTFLTLVYPFHYLLALSVALLREPSRKE